MPTEAQDATHRFICQEIVRLRSYVPQPEHVTDLSDSPNPREAGYLGANDRKVALFRVGGASVFIEEDGQVLEEGLPDCPRYADRLMRDRLPAIAADLLMEGNPHKHFLHFHSHTRESFESYLQAGIPLQREWPFPIAIVSRKMSNEPNGLRGLLLLCDLFEVVVRFIVLIQMADCMRTGQAPQVRNEAAKEAKNLHFLGRPTLGSLLKLFRSMRRVSMDNPFLAEIKSLSIDEGVFDHFLELRNTVIHCPAQPDSYYKTVFKENIELFRKQVHHRVDFLMDYCLVKPIFIMHSGDDCEFSAWKLTGSNPCFDRRNLRANRPLTVGKVYCLNRKREALSLDPFIVVETCTKCDREELLLFDGFSKEKKDDRNISYLGYETCPRWIIDPETGEEKIHRPSYPYAERLPLELRKAKG